MKYYVTRYTPIWKPESVLSHPVAFRYLIERELVETDMQIESVISGRNCALVKFNDGLHPEISGYVPVENIEPYVETFPGNQVVFEYQTPNAEDAQQYITYAGKVQYNLCGPACIAYATGISLATVLDNWKAKDLKWWQSFFNTKTTARGTSDGELQRLLKTLGYESFLLSQALKFPESKEIRYTPGSFARFVDSNIVIASVNVDRAYHFINGGGVLHWVAVIEVIQDRVYGGYVRFWNSLTNALELCSWREWIMTTRNSPYGIAMKR